MHVRPSNIGSFEERISELWLDREGEYRVNCMGVEELVSVCDFLIASEGHVSYMLGGLRRSVAGVARGVRGLFRYDTIKSCGEFARVVVGFLMMTLSMTFLGLGSLGCRLALAALGVVKSVVGGFRDSRRWLLRLVGAVSLLFTVIGIVGGGRGVHGVSDLGRERVRPRRKWKRKRKRCGARMEVYQSVLSSALHVDASLLSERFVDAFGRTRESAWFLVDTGATLHSVNDVKYLSGLKRVHVEADGADGRFTITQAGSMVCECMSTSERIALDSVHLIEKCKYNIVSPHRLVSQGVAREFVFGGTGGCSITLSSGVEVPIIQAKGGLPFVRLSVLVDGEDHERILDSGVRELRARDSVLSVSVDLLRRRLGFMAKDRVRQMVRDATFDGVKVSGTASGPVLDESVDRVARSTRARLPTHRVGPVRAEHPFHTVYSDVASVGTVTFAGARYFVTFIDEYTRFSYVMLMKEKSEVPECFEQFLKSMEAFQRLQCRGVVRKVVRLRTDNGGEYTSAAFRAVCARHSIHHEFTVPETPAENGLAERLNRTLITSANSMLVAASLAAPFWGYALTYANWVRNRCPTKFLGAVSPFTALTGALPHIGHARVFGCDAYVHDHESGKIGPRAKKGIFVGLQYDSTSIAAPRWMVFDVDSREAAVYRHVAFVEDLESRRNILRDYDERVAHLPDGGLATPLTCFSPEFDDAVKRVAVRRLFIDPSLMGPAPMDHRLSERTGVEAEPDVAPRDDPYASGSVGDGVRDVDDESAGTVPGESSGDDGKGIESGPLSEDQMELAAARREVEASGEVVVRPVRLKAIGKRQPLSDADRAFLQHAHTHDYPIKYLQKTPKSGKSKERYERYKAAETLAEAKRLGALGTVNSDPSKSDILWDYERGWIQFPEHESSEMVGVIGTDIRTALRQSGQEDRESVLVQAERSLHLYHDSIASAFPPEPVIDFLQSKISTFNFAAKCVNDLFVATAHSQSSQADDGGGKINTDFKDPEHYHEIRHHPLKRQWEEAVLSEIRGLISSGTVEWMPESAAKVRDDYSKPLKTRYVFRTKVNGDGVGYKYKARLVVRGDLAIPGLHFDDVFAPTASYGSVRTLLSIAAGNGYEIYQADISQAFLQAPLEKTVYIDKPDIPGEFKSTRSGERLVGRLKKSLYGLPSSPRNWYNEYSNFLLSIGFKQTTHDPCVFMKRKRDRVLFTSVFVDDALIVGDPRMRAQFLHQLGKRFPVNPDSTRAADWLLGIKIDRNEDTGAIKITQTQAIINLAKACGLDFETRFHESPMVCGTLPKLQSAQVDKTNCINGLSFRSVIGSLLFISLCVRPDISNAVGILARHSDTPGEEHVKALKKLVSYLFKTKDLGITYSSRDDSYRNRLVTFVDADYGGAHDSRSTSGHVVLMNGGPILWASKVQKLTAQSTTEAETIAAAEVTKEVVYLRGFLEELGITDEVDAGPSLIMEDNSAVTAFAKNLKNRASAKHYVVRLRFLQEMTNRMRVKFIQTPTHDQLADIFTKPLPPDQFKLLRAQIFGLEPIVQLSRVAEALASEK